MTNFRCDCPITSALDVLGDKWALVIVKQLLIEDKITFKDLSESDESIASNILSSKLKWLEQHGIISKRKPPHNHKTNWYVLTEEGLALTPVIIELVLWSDTYLRDVHPEMQSNETLAQIKKDKKGMIDKIQQRYRERLQGLDLEG